jgi:hypothetical protein
LFVHLLIGARAATFIALLLLELEFMHQLQEGGSRLMLTSLDHRVLNVAVRASAARKVGVVLLRLLVSAGRLLAHQFALGTRAQSRLLALPVALGLLAHRSADGLRSGTSSTALSRSANSLALGAISCFAQVLGASHVALRLIAVDLASSARGLLTVHLALRALAHRVALSRARRIIALPSALRVASRALRLRSVDGGDGSGGGGGRGSILHFHLHLKRTHTAQHQHGEHAEEDVRSLHRRECMRMGIVRIS